MNFDHGSRVAQSTLEAVHQLIQANIDSAQGFQEAAADIDEPELARLFRQWSAERFIEADRLRSCVKPEYLPSVPEATWLDSWRRIWLSVRGALNISDRAAMIRELERAEGCVCQIIETMLAEIRDPLLIDVLGRQLNGVRDIMDTLRELRAGLAHTPVQSAETWTSAMVEDTVVSAAANPAEVA